ncbi:hypothetical protein [Streptomyces sp. WAC06614]|uniref:GH85 family endohexosaminidase C-terminal domain-containing protein n=1 Tax=Streptomyces sp. WAC06614 TaxID=2487416 RepID=UPI000F792042|nr:hypothetical protein [Streptomyces sp. WAC06614]RSS81461.1 hypothetical protein EF918_10325 [Streptomyces sp. WAC06614]
MDTPGRRPAVTLDFADAWRGGSSLLVRGAPTAPTVVGLHATRLPLSRSTVVELVHRTDAEAEPGAGPVGVELGVAVREPAAPGEPVPYTWLATSAGPRDSWRTARFRLGALAGRTAYGFAVRLTPPAGGGPVGWRLGALAAYDGRPGRPQSPGGLAVDAWAPDGDRTVALRLSWRRAPGPVRHYELHRVLGDGGRRFLGGTCGTAFHVPGLARDGQEPAAVLEVRAVGELYTAGPPARIRHPW